MDGEISLLSRQNAVFPAHRLRQNFRRRIAHRQRLSHRLDHGGIAQPRRQRVNGQHPAGGHTLAVQVFKDGIGHIVANEVPGDSAVKDVLISVLQLLGGEAVVEKGHIQPSGGIRQLHLGHVQALADVGGAGGVHHHGPETGRHIRRQLRDGYQSGPVLIAPGEMADQVAQGENIQIGKLLCPGLSHPFEDGDRVTEPRHLPHLRKIFTLL